MKRLAFALLLILLSGLAACRTAGNSQSANVATKQIDACSLVPKAQIEQILKAQVAVIQGSPIPNSKIVRYASCSYASWDFSVSADIGLEIYKDVAGATAAFEYHKHHILITEVFDGDKPPGDIPITRQDISGLGDQAFWVITPQFPVIYVQKSNVILSITIGNYQQPVAQVEQQERKLAQLAIRNM